MSAVFRNLHYFLLDATLSRLLCCSIILNFHYLSLTQHFLTFPLTTNLVLFLARWEASVTSDIRLTRSAAHPCLDPDYDREPYLNQPD